MYIEIRATQVLVPKFARRGSPGGLGSPPRMALEKIRQPHPEREACVLG